MNRRRVGLRASIRRRRNRSALARARDIDPLTQQGPQRHDPSTQHCYDFDYDDDYTSRVHRRASVGAVPQHNYTSSQGASSPSSRDHTTLTSSTTMDPPSSEYARIPFRRSTGTAPDFGSYDRFSLDDSRSHNLLQAENWHRRTGSSSTCFIRSSQEHVRLSAAGGIAMPPVPTSRSRPSSLPRSPRGNRESIASSVARTSEASPERRLSRKLSSKRSWRNRSSRDWLRRRRQKPEDIEREERRKKRDEKKKKEQELFNRERVRARLQGPSGDQRREPQDTGVYPNVNGRRDRIDRMPDVEWKRYDALALAKGLPAACQQWLSIAVEDTTQPQPRRGFRGWKSKKNKYKKYYTEVRGTTVLCYDGAPSEVVSMVLCLENALVDKAKTRGAKTKGSKMMNALKSFGRDQTLHVMTKPGMVLTFKFDNSDLKYEWSEKMFERTTKARPATLRDFEVIFPIGKGASGKVFLVKDINTSNFLALKVVRKDKAYRNALAFKHIVNERSILEMCYGMPFAVQLRYAFQTEEYLYIATDFYDGGDLYSLLRAYGGRLEERVARYVIAEVLLALESLHDMKIVYRDLKPENIVLDARGHIRIADFGLAKPLEHLEGHLTKTICGTSAYAAPEMLGRNPYCETLDLWSFGVFIYHCLMGTTPWRMTDLSFPEMLTFMQENPIQFRYPISDNARHLIEDLLVASPRARLTLAELKQHPFFEGINWDEIASKKSQRDGVGPVDLDDIAHGRRDLAPDDDYDRPLSSAHIATSLLRNFDMDEWQDISMTFEHERPKKCRFPTFVYGGTDGLETSAIAGWDWTCPSPLERAGMQPEPVMNDSNAYERSSRAKHSGRRERDPLVRSSLEAPTQNRRSLHKLKPNLSSRRRSLHI